MRVEADQSAQNQNSTKKCLKYYTKLIFQNTENTENIKSFDLNGDTNEFHFATL